MKSYGKFKGVFTWLFNTVVSMYIRLKTNKISHCRALTRERIKNKLYYSSKCSELRYALIKSTESYSWLFNVLVTDVVALNLHPPFFIGGELISLLFLRERGGLRKTWSFYVKKFPKTAGISIFYVVIAVLLFVGHLLTSRRIYRFLITGTLPARQTNPNTQ